MHEGSLHHLPLSLSLKKVKAARCVHEVSRFSSSGPSASALSSCSLHSMALSQIIRATEDVQLLEYCVLQCFGVRYLSYNMIHECSTPLLTFLYFANGYFVQVNEVLSEVSLIKDRQEDLDGKLDTMKNENEALWREVGVLKTPEY